MPAGRPRKILDENEIQKLARLGCTLEEMADFFSVSKDVLVRNYAAAISEGVAESKVSIRRERLRIALDKNHPKQASMLIFMSKIFLGEKEYAVLDNGELAPPIIKIEFATPK